jgi:hypothetical protein
MTDVAGVRVFRVQGDVNTYEHLLADVEMTPGLAAMLRFDGTPKGGTWRPPPAYSYKPTLEAPDIWTFHGHLVFPPALADRLGPLLYRSGELLPFPFNGETWLLLNVGPPINCLDEDASEWAMGTHDPTKRLSLRKMAFHRRRLPDTLFVVPEARVTVLCVEGLAGREDEFKATVEDLGLTGLRFELLWDSEAVSVTA